MNKKKHIVSLFFILGILVWFFFYNTNKNDVYAINYGYSQTNFLGDPEEKNWYFYLIRNGRKNILVDTGFDSKSFAQKWNLKKHIDPVTILGELGIEADDIDHVILSHLHWDHAGALHRFNKAKIWIQSEEYEMAKRIFSERIVSHAEMNIQDYASILKIEQEKRLKILKGNTKILGGIQCILDGLHCKGHQYVVVPTKFGNIIISGGVMYKYGEIANNTDIPESSRRLVHNMQNLVASPLLILPAHDIEIMKIFSNVSENIAKVSSSDIYDRLEKYPTK